MTDETGPVTEEPPHAETDIGRHKAAVLAPLDSLRRMGGSWNTVAAVFEAMVHALFAGPPEPPSAEALARPDDLPSGADAPIVPNPGVAPPAEAGLTPGVEPATPPDPMAAA